MSSPVANPQDRLVTVQLRMAVACVVLGLLSGLLAVLHYVPELSPGLHEAGFGLTRTRPLHTTLLALWIYGAAVAVMYHYLAGRGGGLDRGDVRRFWFHTGCWLAAGVGIVVTLAMGFSTGREYAEFHWIFSALLLTGWFAFAWTFLKRLRLGFWDQPIYVWFWTIGVVYFVFTFVEFHAYLLPTVHEQPLRDLQLQWKSCGTLVGSFNFLVYGALSYIAEKVSGDKRYGQSPIAFALFGVGCLNSFTNYAHHTYHLPQDPVVKWIAFVVSMIEIVILLKLFQDIAKSLRQQPGGGPRHPAAPFLTSAKWWTTAMLFLSIVISVPNLNSVIHGTHVVTGHAMGTELGIDSMVLFAAITFLLAQRYQGSSALVARLGDSVTRKRLAAVNITAAVFTVWLLASGTAHGWSRYHGEPPPHWVDLRWIVFPVVGGAVAGATLSLMLRWLPLLFGRATAPVVTTAAGAVPPPVTMAGASQHGDG
ncbi:MAG TPA: cbb3-type cytochrome c oxidase subunit I [Planctomycetota bacterium]